MGVGAGASGGRTAELLKVAASGSGVVTSSGAWTWSRGMGDDLPSAKLKPFATIPNTFGLHSILEIYKETSSG